MFKMNYLTQPEKGAPQEKAAQDYKKENADEGRDHQGAHPGRVAMVKTGFLLPLEKIKSIDGDVPPEKRSGEMKLQKIAGGLGGKGEAKELPGEDRSPKESVEEEDR